MKPDEAEQIFYEFGDVLSNQWLNMPERFGARLRCVSREGLRKAILMWVAKQKFEGADIYLRQGLQPEQEVAILELAQKVWWFTFIFGPPLRNGTPIPDSDEVQKAACIKHDEFLRFLRELNTRDPAYWEKVEAKLDTA